MSLKARCYFGNDDYTAIATTAVNVQAQKMNEWKTNGAESKNGTVDIQQLESFYKVQKLKEHILVDTISRGTPKDTCKEKDGDNGDNIGNGETNKDNGNNDGNKNVISPKKKLNPIPTKGKEPGNNIIDNPKEAQPRSDEEKTDNNKTQPTTTAAAATCYIAYGNAQYGISIKKGNKELTNTNVTEVRNRNSAFMILGNLYSPTAKDLSLVALTKGNNGKWEFVARFYINKVEHLGDKIYLYYKSMKVNILIDILKMDYKYNCRIELHKNANETLSLVSVTDNKKGEWNTNKDGTKLLISSQETPFLFSPSKEPIIFSEKK